jgi:hypothetical protein
MLGPRPARAHTPFGRGSVRTGISKSSPPVHASQNSGQLLPIASLPGETDGGILRKCCRSKRKGMVGAENAGNLAPSPDYNYSLILLSPATAWGNGLA